LNSKSSSVRVDDIVVFLGRQLQEKVLKLLEATTIFCLPSIITDKGGREGIPVALMEAMAMELPVVSTRTVGIPELIEHQREGLLVPQKDPVSLASALEKLLDNKELRIAMGSAARKKVMKDFNIANIPKSFETIFGLPDFLCIKSIGKV